MEYSSYLLTALATLGMMGADRFRGAGGTYFLKCDWYASIFFGFIMMLLLGYDEPLILLGLVAAYKLGESWGWGSPLGDYLTERPKESWTQEEWQKGVLKNNLELALLFRGLMWATPVAAFLWFIEEDAILSYITVASFTLSFLIAPYLSIRFIDKSDRWAWQEELRGGLQIFPIALYLGYMYY